MLENYVKNVIDENEVKSTFFYIALTSFSSNGDQQAIMQHDFNFFMTKTVQLDRFSSAVMEQMNATASNLSGDYSSYSETDRLDKNDA